MQVSPEQLLADWFQAHQLGPGGRVPPERALAEMLGLSRATLRRALAALAAEGSLVRHVGRGTFLHGTATVLPEAPPSPDSLARRVSPRDALHARLTVEPELARLAAVNATERQIAALSDFGAAVAAARTWPDYDRADALFHRHVAEATNNAVLVASHELVAAAFLGIKWGRLRHRGEVPGSGQVTLAEHAAVVSAIGDRDGEGAANALRHHLRVEASAVMGALI